jgi:hypothetical protein
MALVQDEKKAMKNNYQYKVKSVLVKPENLHIQYDQAKIS